MLRIIAGEFRSRPLAVPRGRDLTRPMGSRTREALFDLLRGWFDGATVVDLFAGVGSLGLEAASRGAARVVCVERDRMVARLLRENVESFGCGDRVQVIEADVLAESTFAALPKPVDVAFCDPPFALALEPREREHPLSRRDRTRFEALLARLRGLFAHRGFLALRLPEARRGAEGVIPGFDGPEIHGYGDQQWVHLYAPSSSAPAPASAPDGA